MTCETPTIEEVSEWIREIAEEKIPQDQSYNQTARKTLEKYRMLLAFLKTGVPLKFTGSSVVLKDKVEATLYNKRWRNVGKSTWYRYSDPQGLVNKLFGDSTREEYEPSAKPVRRPAYLPGNVTFDKYFSSEFIAKALGYRLRKGMYYPKMYLDILCGELGEPVYLSDGQYLHAKPKTERQLRGILNQFAKESPLTVVTFFNVMLEDEFNVTISYKELKVVPH
jgi:hypothetical protein